MKTAGENTGADFVPSSGKTCRDMTELTELSIKSR